MQKPSRKTLLKGVPYSKAQLKDMTIGELWQLAAMLGAPTREKKGSSLRLAFVDLCSSLMKSGVND